MKKRSFQLYLGFSLIVLAASCHSPSGDRDGETADTASLPNPSPAALKVVFPEKGQKLVKGETYTLKWAGGEEKLSIFLIDSALEQAGASVSITDRVYEIDNKGTYGYTVPETIPEGTYKFTIGKGSSAYFQIVSP